ncbi:YfgM family protein, partial [Cronobacter sakazakii]
DDPKTLSAAQQFVAQNQNTYGALAALELAQRYVDKNDLTNAAQQLQKGLENTKDENLRSLINLRLARIQIQQKQADAALKTLESVKGENWSAMVADLRGDALLSKGDKQGARDAWSKGADDKNSPALGDMMQMKINNLSI